eukprot:195769_1
MSDGIDTEMAGMKQKQQGHGRSFSVDGIKGPSKTVMILVYVLLAYSVIVSTVALIMCIMALGNSGSSSASACDCTVNSLAAKTELSDNNGLGDSGFCAIVDYCMSTDVTDGPTMSPNTQPTVNPSNQPTISPTKYPTVSPSIKPSNSPSNNPITAAIEPYDGYYIGDYKFSLRISDHGHWKICDGDFLAANGEYALLFAEIAYQFGRYIDPISNQSYFKLPNITDAVVGIAGNSHMIGDELFGSETMTLTQSHIPSHSHYIAIAGACVGTGSGDYMATQGVACNRVGTPNSWPTS